MIVHLIVNSHLDPVWLWKREQGIDEVLATARTACQVLEEFPEVHITRGEAWFYETIRELDPVLYRRIQLQVAAGRWHIVGGWYIQPDCNLLMPESYRKHGEIGGEFFRREFGVRVKTGFNVDSFGHGACLPDFYAACGIENYVYMRPNSTEMPGAPPHLFLWESEKGARLTTYRLSRAYCTTGLDPAENFRLNLEATLAETAPGEEHAMCFIGVGDHGGGPAREEIRWALDHLEYRPGVTLRFSHPDAYFEVVRGEFLPLYRGELHHHAIGCYSALRRIKRELLRSEERLLQAERFTGEPASRWEEAWKKVLFAGFHDILSGTCIRSAYEDIYDDLGSVRSEALRALSTAVRRRNVALPEAPHQRLIFDNPGGGDYSGLLEFEPWAGYLWVKDAPPALYHLETLEGKVIPSQRLTPEALNPLLRYAAPLNIPAGGRRIFYLIPGAAPVAPGRARAGEGGRVLENALLRAELGPGGVASLQAGGREYLREPSYLAVHPDASDTWSHGLRSYEEPERERLTGGSFRILEDSPEAGLLAASAMDLTNGQCRFSVEDGVPALRLRLRLNWNRTQSLLKFSLPVAFPVREWLGGCPGGTVRRPADGAEYPFYRFAVLEGEGMALAVVSADFFSADLRSDGTLRLTLLRSPYYAHHDPTPVPEGTFAPVTDRGEHEFDITLLALPEYDPKAIADELLRLEQPILFSELTR